MGSIGIPFVTAKSRIVPSRKKITVPRIELLGNCILARLMSSVREAIREEIAVDNFLCWSNSMISLAWIKSDKELKVFEENRVQDIRKPVNPDKWFHCKSEENPADVITRFNHLNEKKNNLYYNGPLFLKDINEDEKIESNVNHINKNVYDVDDIVNYENEK